MRFTMYLSILIVLISSCVKDYKSSTATYLKNSTTHKIEIIPYESGSINNADYKLVEANQDLKAFSSNVYGKTLSPDFGTMLSFYDSVVVKYDDTISITHLKSNTTIVSGHYVFQSSNRNIFDVKNYVKTVEKDTKHYLVGNYRYTFNEQDYLDAK